MAGVSMGTGLTSGIDYSSMITQLMQIEAQPQTLLKSQLSDVQSKASALRQVNTAFASLGSAAQSLTQAAAWNPAKATSSTSTVTATAASGAQSGTLSFTVDQLATAHAVVAGASWDSTAKDFGLGSKLTFASTDGATTFGSVTLKDADGNGTVSLAEAVSAINSSGLGYQATAVNTGSGYKLQVTSTATGAAKAFKITSDTQAASAYDVLTQGLDAKITIGADSSTTKAIKVTSATNTFTGVMDGTTFTVSQAGTSATISVGTDTSAITASVKALVDAANKAVSAVQTNTDSSDGSTAVLKGNSTLNNLASQILTQVSSAVGTTSPATLGLQLSKDGKSIQFDTGTFATALAADPTIAQKIFGGTTGVGPDNVANTPDDRVVVDGLAARLSVLAETASDSVGGVITALANGQDTQAKDLQSQIDDWTLRLQQRQDTMTAQFNALETALGSLQSQSSWLTQQINSLPGWSTSSSS